MNLIFSIIFAAAPVTAGNPEPVSVSSAVPMELAVDTFEEDAEDVWTKVRRLMSETKLKKYTREINLALAKHEPDAAQKALDGMLRDFPEIGKQEPHAVEYQQGRIDFWRKDFKGAYEEFDKVVKAMSKKYPKGVPPGGKYSELNTAFMSDAYFCRGAALLQLRNYPQAILDFDKAIATSQVPAAFRQLNKGRALIQMRKFKEAAGAYEAAAKIDPDWVKKEEDTAWICRVMAANGHKPEVCQSGK